MTKLKHLKKSLGSVVWKTLYKDKVRAGVPTPAPWPPPHPQTALSSKKLVEHAVATILQSKQGGPHRRLGH